jgi:hypothetical protein
MQYAVLNTASIVPVFKKGDRHQASNYRSVSLTSIACKLLEHIIHSQVMDHYGRHNILSDKQQGFRSKRSCETQLSVAPGELVSNAFEKSSSIICTWPHGLGYVRCWQWRLITGSHRNVWIWSPVVCHSGCCVCHNDPSPDYGWYAGEAGVLKLLNNINSHKATGPDGIPARLLHEYASYNTE